MYSEREIFQLIETPEGAVENVLVNVFTKYLYYFHAEKMAFSLLPFPDLDTQETKYMSANMISALLPVPGNPFNTDGNAVGVTDGYYFRTAKKEDLGV